MDIRLFYGKDGAGGVVNLIDMNHTNKSLFCWRRS